LHPSGVAKSSTSFGWGKSWNVTAAGCRQVTLCDPIWHVSSSSGVTTSVSELLYLCYLLTFTLCGSNISGALVHISPVVGARGSYRTRMLADAQRDGRPRVPQTRQQISAVSGPKFTILWKRVEEILLFNKFFFRLSIRSLVAKTQQSCAMVPRWRFLATFCVLYFQRAACSRFQTCIVNSH